MQSLTWPAIIALVGCLVNLVFAGITFKRRAVRPAPAQALLIYTLLSSLWMLSVFVGEIGWLQRFASGLLDHLPHYGLLILSIAFLQLTWTLLEARGGWFWLVLGGLWLGGTIILDFNPMGLPEVFVFTGGWGLYRVMAVTLLLTAGWAVMMVATTVLNLRTLRKQLRFYTVVTYWVFCIILTVAGNGLFFVGRVTEGIILSLLGTALAVYIVTVARLAELAMLVRRSIGFLVFTGLAVVTYATGLILSQVIFGNRTPLNLLIYGIVVALVFVLLFNPLLGRLEKWINRSMGRRNQGLSDLLVQYSQTITNTLDLNLLATVAVGTASEYLEVNRGFLFLVDNEKINDKSIYTLRGVKGMGKENPESCQLADDSPLTAYFRQAYKPLTQSDIDFKTRFKELAPEERKWLKKLGVDIYTPIFAKNEWIGMLALGPKSSGAAYTNEDMTFLRMMADQTAVALENTRLVEGLMRVNKDFRRAYEALDQANRQLERLDKTKSDFISIASHELRTPLTLISGASQMLLDEPSLQTNPYYKQLLTKMYSGTVRLHEIVESMLDVAKIDTRALELDPQPVSLSSLLKTVCGDLRKSATERKQTIEIQNLDQLPSIAADATALRKVFYHLVVNAIKYTPDGGKITISGNMVEANLTDLPQGGVEIVVQDTGIGIDPRFHELIFAKFYQTGELALHSSGKTKFKGGGPGLGLAIARGVVEAHRGKIWVESPGYDEARYPGSAFHVILPSQQQHTSQPVLPLSVATPTD